MTFVLDPGVKLMLLDHDDVQVGTIKAKWAAHKAVAKTYYDHELTDAELRRFWGIPLPELVCRLYSDTDPDRALSRYMPTAPDFPKTLFPGTLSVLRWPRRAGRLVGVVTATTLESLEYDWETLGFPDGAAHFDYIQPAEASEFHKPDPRVFDPAIAWAAARWIDPAEIGYAGDGLHDLTAAVGARLQFVGVATGLVSVAEFEAAGAVAVPTLPGIMGD